MRLIQKTGAIVGTPGYLAPEQLIEPDNEPHPSLDCYAAAIVIIEVLTGKRPFGRGSLADTIKRQLEKPVEAAILMEQGIPRAVAEVLAKGVHKDRKSRFQEAPTFLERFKEAASIVPSVAVTQQLLPTKVGGIAKDVITKRTKRRLSVVMLCLLVIILAAVALVERGKTPDFSATQLLFFERVKAMNANSSVPSALKLNELLDLASSFSDLTTPKLRREWPKAIADIGPHNFVGIACKGARLAGLGKNELAYKDLFHSLWTVRKAYKDKEPYFAKAHEIDIALVYRVFDVQDDVEVKIDIIKEAMRFQKRYPPEVQLGQWGATMRLQFLLLLSHVKELGKTEATKRELEDMEGALMICRPFEKKTRSGHPLGPDDFKAISAQSEKLRKEGA